MDKLLFYSNDWEDYKVLIGYVEKLEGEGFEVAVATDKQELIRALSVGKLLVVNPETYHYDLVVTDNKSFEERLGIKDFFEAFK